MEETGAQAIGCRPPASDVSFGARLSLPLSLSLTCYLLSLSPVSLLSLSPVSLSLSPPSAHHLFLPATAVPATATADSINGRRQLPLPSPCHLHLHALSAHVACRE